MPCSSRPGVNIAVRIVAIAALCLLIACSGCSVPSRGFVAPTFVAVDSAGNLYVTDTNTHRISKILPSGTTSTFAGSGTRGFADGAAAQAQFSDPQGIAVDANGNVYVAEYGNNRVRKVTPDGTVSTLAGSGTMGFADGPGTEAQFAHPRGIAVDAHDNVYVADAENNRVRKVAPDGAVSTLAGSGTSGYLDGSAAVAQFREPYAVAVDGSGIVYVAESSRFIRRIALDGTVSTVNSSVANSPAVNRADTAVTIGLPEGIAIASNGTIYVADATRNAVLAISPSGAVSKIAGGNAFRGFADGHGASAQFSHPLGLAVDGAGLLYIVDSDNQRIRKMTPDGTVSTVKVGRH